MEGDKNLTYKDAVVITGEMWRSISKEEKDIYVKDFEKDWKEYIKMKAEWNLNYSNLDSFNTYDDYMGPMKPPKRP